MQVLCRSCQQPIPAQNVNLQNMVAKCDQCNAVFGISPQQLYGGPQQPGMAPGGPVAGGGMPLPFGGAGPGGYVAIERGQAPMPAGMTVEIDGKDLVIRRSWFTWMAIFLLFFSLFWNGFILFFLVVVVGIGAAAANQAGPAGLIALVFLAVPLLFGAIGICLMYYTLCLFVNSTTIRVDHAELSVSHGPLPWWGNVVYPRSDVVQLFCIERVHYGRKGGISFTYDVEIITRGNVRYSLVSTLPDMGQALFIEQQLERHLGIQDVPVAGEVRRW